MPILKKLGGILLMLILCIGFVIILGSTTRYGIRDFGVFLIGVVIFIPFYIYLYLETNKFTYVSKEDIAKINTLKSDGIKLPVDLEHQKISKTRKTYSSRVIHNTARTGALNQFLGNPDDNIETIEHDDNEIHFKVPYGNNFIKFKTVIDMEPTTLLLHFAVKKQTFLYVNPANMKDYYLDLEFLKS